MSMEFVNRICPNCKNPNYMVSLGDFSKAYKYKCMNCNGYFNDIDFSETLQPVWLTERMNKKADKEISSRIMDDVGNIINEITTRVAETRDEFIFQTISRWWEDKTQMVISKKELIDALTLYKKLVRCKECKHYFNGCCYSRVSNRINFTVETPYDWYCADGEHKEER